MLVGEMSDFIGKLGADGTTEAFRAIFPHIEFARVAGAGHMLHIEKPELVAPLVESFLEEHG
jgi:pimeloyl-ACP methyl ester carboxylesterase